jgi:hypothetical protein
VKSFSFLHHPVERPSLKDAVATLRILPRPPVEEREPIEVPERDSGLDDRCEHRNQRQGWRF